MAPRTGTVHTTVFFSLVMGIATSVLGVIYTPTILRWMGTPANVMSNSVLYFRIYCGGLLALVLYDTATGIFQALGDSRCPLYYLIISSIANVVLDILFVAVLDWRGVAGAVLATVWGQILSAVLAFGVRQARIEAIFFCFLGFTNACVAVLRGGGQSVTPIVVLLAVWCVFRILYITVFVALVPDITVVFSACPVTWVISSLLFFIAVKRRDWTKDAVLDG